MTQQAVIIYADVVLFVHLSPRVVCKPDGKGEKNKASTLYKHVILVNFIFSECNLVFVECELYLL